MPPKAIVRKQMINSRLLKSNGSWMYCSKCNSTIGYLCYSTYDYFIFKFVCNCGEQGMVEVGTPPLTDNIKAKETLLLKKGRLCCPSDQSPLLSIVGKNLKQYSLMIVCKNCKSIYESQHL